MLNIMGEKKNYNFTLYYFVYLNLWFPVSPPVTTVSSALFSAYVLREPILQTLLTKIRLLPLIMVHSFCYPGDKNSTRPLLIKSEI